MRMLHVSALWIWAMKGKGGMPSLRETVRGHVDAGHEVVMILPNYDLFSDDSTPFVVDKDQDFEIHLTRCSWLRLIKILRVGARRLGGGEEMPYVARWALNLVIAALLTVSLFLTALRVRYRSRRQFDLVYAHNQYAAAAGWLCAKVFRVPNVTRLYGTFLADLMKRPFVWLRYPVAAAGYLVPHRLLICANDGTRGDKVARALRIDLDRFRFWQNGVDLPPKPPEATRQELVDRFGAAGLRADSKWAVSCSRLSSWKRIDRMLHALAGCRKRGCDCQLLVAGDGAERQRLRALSMELGLENEVIWLGAVAHDDIWSLMNLADVFMITNDVTNRCNPLYEAMCAALPIVSVVDSSTGDLLEHEVNALLADKQDVEALGRYLSRACSDRVLAEKMKQAQRRRAEDLWTWQERMVAEVRELEALTCGGLQTCTRAL